MLIAILSDIHGNLEALMEVLADVDAHRPDAVISLGDTVGYGPDPEAVLDTLAERQIESVCGNHEQGLLHPSLAHTFNPQAAAALKRTRELLSPEALKRIAAFPASLSRFGHRFVHGLPPDDALTYLFEANEADLRYALSQTPERLTFVGHTHLLDGVVLDGLAIRHFSLPLGPTTLDPNLRYILNVGSVGQPRDGDNRAKYALLNDITQTITIQAIPYDIATTAHKIVERGLPKRYADRLW